MMITATTMDKVFESARLLRKTNSLRRPRELFNLIRFGSNIRELPSTNPPGPDSVLAGISHLSRRPRPAGSEADAAALAEMRAAIESSDRFGVEEDVFEFERYIPEKWELKVDGDERESVFAVCSASTPRGGISAPLRRSDSADLDGSVALLRISSVHESIAVEELAGRGALGVVAYHDGGPTLVGRVRYPRSSIPCLMVGTELGEALWNESAMKGAEVEFKLRARTAMTRGTSLFAVPRLTPAKLLFVAHRDSRPLSPGAIDNASGSALLLFLSASSRNPHFGLLSTDAEEYGLLGARAFMRGEGRVKRDTEVVNLDSVGSGTLRLVERSRAGPLSAELNAKLSRIAEGAGRPLGTLTTPRGSDSDIFAEAGLRSSWVRSYPTPTATTIDDTASHVDVAVLDDCCSLLRGLAAAAATS